MKPRRVDTPHRSISRQGVRRSPPEAATGGEEIGPDGDTAAAASGEPCRRIGTTFRRGRPRALAQATLSIALAATQSGCLGPMPQPLLGLNSRLEAIGSSRAPALAGRWLALIGGRDGREQVQLIDLERQLPVPLPGLNRPDAQPVAVAVEARGEKLAVVRQLEGRTELVLYRRGLTALEPIAMQPAGVPRRLSLRADGRELAVEVSRGGVWQVDLIEVP